MGLNLDSRRHVTGDLSGEFHEAFVMLEIIKAYHGVCIPRTFEIYDFAFVVRFSDFFIFGNFPISRVRK